jgi:L-threonylcarbamoyladenylate synthase
MPSTRNPEATAGNARVAHVAHVANTLDTAAVAAAAQALARGELVAFPTETVYGLGARADSDAAVARIFEAKGRPADHPLIVHVASLAAARAFAARWPAAAEALGRAFWPGPLTVIVPRVPTLGTAAAGGQSSIGLRVPAHPVAQALLRAAAASGVTGVAAPSANRFGRVSPTTAEHVLAEFGPQLRVLDGGPCAVGIESAIVDCTGEPPALLRPGQLTRGHIEAALGQRLAERSAASPRASGTLEAHYAPRATVVLLDESELAARTQRPPTGHERGIGVYSRRAAALGWLHRRMPEEAGAAAHELFAALRAFDDAATHTIWVARVPAEPSWDGVRDRLERAAAATPPSSHSDPAP